MWCGTGDGLGPRGCERQPRRYWAWSSTIVGTFEFLNRIGQTSRRPSCRWICRARCSPGRPLSFFTGSTDDRRAVPDFSGLRVCRQLVVSPASVTNTITTAAVFCVPFDSRESQRNRVVQRKFEPAGMRRNCGFEQFDVADNHIGTLPTENTESRCQQYTVFNECAASCRKPISQRLLALDHWS